MAEYTFEELIKNEDFMKALNEAKTDDEIRNVFAQQGMQITDEELAVYRNGLEGNAELDEEDLECVNGGVWWIIPVAVALWLLLKSRKKR